jgi:hypothetical protein
VLKVLSKTAFSTGKEMQFKGKAGGGVGCAKGREVGFQCGMVQEVILDKSLSLCEA